MASEVFGNDYIFTRSVIIIFIYWRNNLWCYNWTTKCWINYRWIWTFAIYSSHAIQRQRTICNRRIRIFRTFAFLWCISEISTSGGKVSYQLILYCHPQPVYTAKNNRMIHNKCGPRIRIFRTSKNATVDIGHSKK